MRPPQLLDHPTSTPPGSGGLAADLDRGNAMGFSPNPPAAGCRRRRSRRTNPPPRTPPVHVQLPRRTSPILLHALPQILGQPGEPFRVAPRIQPPDRPPKLLLGQELEVVPPAFMGVDQGVPLSGTHRPVTAPTHRLEQPTALAGFRGRRRCRRVSAWSGSSRGRWRPSYRRSEYARGGRNEPQDRRDAACARVGRVEVRSAPTGEPSPRRS